MKTPTGQGILSTAIRELQASQGPRMIRSSAGVRTSVTTRGTFVIPIARGDQTRRNSSTNLPRWL